MKYRESLPGDCPPEESVLLYEARDFFRLVRSNPPTEDDFRSWRAMNPLRGLPGNVSECRARGLSVYALLGDAQNARKLPNLRGLRICRVQLTQEAGEIQQTGTPSHHTWWPLAAFDVIGHCGIESE